MKAKELMIDDWVYCTYWPEKRIVSIWELKRDNNDELMVVVMDGAPLVPQEKYIEPILLTPEILNRTIDDCPAQLADGKSEWQILMLHDGNDDDPAYDVIIADRGNGIYETTLINHDTGKRFDGVIRYVHELQYALRLCGIIKEITL